MRVVGLYARGFSTRKRKKLSVQINEFVCLRLGGGRLIFIFEEIYFGVEEFAFLVELHDLEALRSFRDDVHAAVFVFLNNFGDVRHAADLGNRVFLRAHDSERFLVDKGLADHLLVTGFEDVQRQGSAGKQDNIEREQSDLGHELIVRQSVLAFQNVNIVLISTYELGHQPFGLASPAAWLRREGHEVFCLDTSQQALKDFESTLAEANAVAFHLPMHTATRIAMHAIRRVRALNPKAQLCAYGLYAPMNAELLHEAGVERVIGGEFERELVEWAGKQIPRGLTSARGDKTLTVVSLDRLQFLPPDRTGLPRLAKYAKLKLPSGEERVAGYTEATRGCKHLCRHCPIVPVYNGAFRVVQRDVVLADIRQQVAAGAQHMTFGDPDFFNGPTHAMDIVEQLHREFPGLSYDVTIKVEHLLKHADLLPRLRDTGCRFVVSAVESFDDRALERLDKGHTRDGFFKVVQKFREVGLNLSPTFVAFHPWTTLDSYREFLAMLADQDLIENIQPIQLAIRLLIPAGSRLLELPEIQGNIGGFDREALAYPWRNPDPRVDDLQRELEAMIQRATKSNLSRRQIFAEVCRLTDGKLGRTPSQIEILPDRATIPYLTEPWYC